MQSKISSGDFPLFLFIVAGFLALILSITMIGILSLYL